MPWETPHSGNAISGRDDFRTTCLWNVAPWNSSGLSRPGWRWHIGLPSVRCEVIRLQKHTESKSLRVLLDAQLPVRLIEILSGLGFDVIHTNFLTNKNHSTDAELIAVCEKDKRVLVSKDRDFVDSFVVRNKPEKFLWLTTGNISNERLVHIFQKHHQTIKDLFELHFFVELTNEDLIVHQ